VKGMNCAYGARKLLVHATALISLVLAGPAFAAEKLVLAFGDSLMAGYRLKQHEGFAPQLQAALRRSGIAARVHNAGVSGDTTTAGRARLAWVLAGLKAKPDLAIVELGANDMLRGLPPEQARANLDAILAELRKRRIPVLLAGMAASRNLDTRYRARFDPIYPELAKKYGAPLYPFFLNGVVGRPGLLLGDAIHPNAKGVAVIVRGILPQVKAALAR
jgi:acyl-CoA thioesterase-1